VPPNELQGSTSFLSSWCAADCMHRTCTGVRIIFTTILPAVGHRGTMIPVFSCTHHQQSSVEFGTHSAVHRIQIVWVHPAPIQSAAVCSAFDEVRRPLSCPTANIQDTGNTFVLSLIKEQLRLHDVIVQGLYPDTTTLLLWRPPKKYSDCATHTNTHTETPTPNPNAHVYPQIVFELNQAQPIKPNNNHHPNHPQRNQRPC
jgi:hypothetical protein